VGAAGIVTVGFAAEPLCHAPNDSVASATAWSMVTSPTNTSAELPGL